MDSFKNNYKESKNDKKDILTKLPSPESKYGSIISNPFHSISSQNNSNNSSRNQFFLLSPNKTENNNLTNDICNNNNPINILLNNENYQNINSNILMNKIPRNKKVSYYQYLNLKIRNNNSQALTPSNNDLKYNLDKIPRELTSINYHNWIFKMKKFISKILISNLISKHDNNISNLNLCLFNLGLKIINTLPEDESNEYLNVLNEKMLFVNSNKINDIIDNNILFQKLKNQYDKSEYDNFNNNIKNNKGNIFPSLNKFNTFLNERKESNDQYSNETQLKTVFFGDTNKIKQILSIIENKIYSLQNSKEYKNNKYQKRRLIVKIINSYENPFLEKDISKAEDINHKEINDVTLIRLQG
jgi:hypothetical protein